MDEMDLEELKAMFLEECREHVDTLEQGLLEMSNADHTSDLLNEIFRAAHSIKGGGATFGFADLAELTHHMETLLDAQRSGRKPITEADIELLLESLDVVRALMESLGDADHPDRLGLQLKLQAAVGEQSAEATQSPDTGDVSTKPMSTTHSPENADQSGWRISFKPRPDLLRKGNDPLLLITELQALGELTIKLDESWLPPWEFFEPRTCYLPFQAELKGQIERESIEAVFEWVAEDCDVTLEALSSAAPIIDKNRPDEPSIIDTPARDNASSDTQPAEGLSEDGKSQQEELTEQSVASRPAKVKPAAATEVASIRVSTEKIDQLMNLVGELVITQSMLSGLSDGEQQVNPEQLRERLSELGRNTRQLQEGVMRVRMLPVSVGFGRLPRLVRDLSRKLSKKVDLVIEGAETEIDKTVLEQMMDPLVHLVRNSVDHGLETPEKRRLAGKRDTGVVKLIAYHQSGSVVIEITDDGAGIDTDRILSKARERGIVGEEELSVSEIQQLIFAPGFSTAEVVSDVSGRGVGMDVVRRNIVDLGGLVEISSTLGSGTTVTIRLPLTLAILDGQLIACAEEVFVIPLANIIETVELKNCKVSTVPQFGSVFMFRGEYQPLVRLNELFELTTNVGDALIVVIETHGQIVGLVIDKVVGQQQIVIKALEDNYQSVAGVTGATIMSDGSVALIIDPQALIPAARVQSAA